MSDPPASSSSDGTMKTMVIFGSVAFVLLSITYAVCWFRGKDRQRSFERNVNDNEEGTQATETPPPPPKFTDHSKRSERSILVNGTISLGIFLWMGATAVLILSLLDQSKYKTASIRDFESLGPQGCWVEDTVSYQYYDEKLDALNRQCVEEWEYSVQVVSTGQVFTSSPMSVDSCRAECDQCRKRLYGPKLYLGTDATRRGTFLTNSTRILVECWAPTIPVQDLSDFYPCGNQLSMEPTEPTCFLLRDPTEKLQKRLDSSNIGLYSAYASYAGGALVLAVAAYFHYRLKRKALEEKLNGIDKEGEEEEAEEMKEATALSPPPLNLEEGEREEDTIQAMEVPSVQNQSSDLEGAFPEGKQEQTA